MDDCLHRPDPGSVVGDSYDRTGICGACGQYIKSFYVDGDEDRRGTWSRWKLLRYVIEEEPELWNASDSSNTCSNTTSPETCSGTTPATS